MRVSDQNWAILVGFLVVAGLRLLDWFLPKGRHSRWADQHSIESRYKSEDEDEKG